MAKENLGRKKPAKKPPDPRVELMKQMVENADGKVPFMYRCNKCGYTALKNEPNKSRQFMTSFSKLNVGNDCKLPICKKCINDLFEQYVKELGSEKAAARRVCMKYDIYYNDEILDATMEFSKPQERMSYYVAKTATMAYANRTYDDTLKEDAEKNRGINTFDDMLDSKQVSEETVKFWGFGFEPEDYEYLDNKYVEWSTSYPVEAKAMESIIQKICMMELQILKGIQQGEKVDALYRQLKEFMDAAGIQPKQNSENVMSDTAAFGVLIKRWEDEDPIPEPEPKWRDIDGIRRYISVFFLGHLSKMFGFKNNWNKLYEDEIRKYTVDKPDFNGVDIDTVNYEDIFGSESDNEQIL